MRMPKRQRLQLVRRMVNSKNQRHQFKMIAELAGVDPAQITRDVQELRKGRKLWARS